MFADSACRVCLSCAGIAHKCLSVLILRNFLTWCTEKTVEMKAGSKHEFDTDTDADEELGTANDETDDGQWQVVGENTTWSLS